MSKTYNIKSENKKLKNKCKKKNNTWKVQNWIKIGGFKMITDKKE